MGQQHNSHVANATHETIKIVLTDANSKETSQIIEPKKYCCISTSQGKVTLSVFQLCENNFMTTPIATYTNDSDRSFIVKTVGNGYINVSRTKYGSIWSEETGLQHLFFSNFIRHLCAYFYIIFYNLIILYKGFCFKLI